MLVEHQPKLSAMFGTWQAHGKQQRIMRYEL
jgi:hypothetical protein